MNSRTYVVTINYENKSMYVDQSPVSNIIHLHHFTESINPTFDIVLKFDRKEKAIKWLEDNKDRILWRFKSLNINISVFSLCVTKCSVNLIVDTEVVYAIN